MSLKVTPVSQCLEKKLKFFGFEVPDLLFILFFLSIINFIFSGFRWKLFLVWIPTAILALVLRIGKHGKPDNYLIHKIKFTFQPKILRAFPEATDFKNPPTIKERGI
ncbi:MAG: hypothetical protein A4S09_03355 [Proteobacteria bacterium SG_bin7]|nr:MAG: hypothetical protein A4S09_03355 [Proteobacteria bacterium SG_bin7]